MDHRVRTRADPGTPPKGTRLDLLPLLSAYGRDRRVAVRIERLPSRARLSRGRNNGDGSWSVTRDELEDLSYIPPKGGSEAPTLVVRVIGLESDNGATLAVVDYPVLPDDEAGDESGTEQAPQSSARREAEFRQLRAELAKTKAALRANQSELASARQLWEVELEEQLAEAAASASEELERNRAAWQGQSKDRSARSDARIQERIAEARGTWERESESELAKAEATLKEAEAARFAAAEAKWREQSARALAKESAELKRIREALSAARNSPDDSELRRLQDEVESLRSNLSDREGKLEEVQSAASQAQEAARATTRKALANAERVWKADEASRSAAANAKWQEQSALDLAEMAKRLERTEAALAQVQSVATQTQKGALAGTQKALADAEQAWKAGEASRFGAAQAKWQEKSALDVAETAKRLERTEEALAEACTETNVAQERRDTAELRSLREELATARKSLADREKQLAETQATGGRARKRLEQDTAAALVKAKQAWKGDEEARFAAAEKSWQQQLAREVVKSAEERERSESALKAARLETKAALDRRDTAETRRLNDALRAMHSTLENREVELAAAQSAAKEAAEWGAKGTELALAKAEKEWAVSEAVRIEEAKAQWKEQSERILKKAALKLEGAEAVLAEARAEANSARDLREGTELRRLRTEFAAARAKVTALESELAQAQLAATRARERTREEIEAALGKAEEALKTNEAVRIAAIETQERERGARALGEVVARLERTETALKEARAQAEAECDGGTVALAEAVTKYERTESQLKEALTLIDTMRDPVNESELGRLRSELATIQIAYSELEAEVARARADARRARDHWSERSKAAVMRAEEAWRIDEAKRLTTAKRDWERDARFGARIDAPLDEPIESLPENRANRLLLDSALAVALAAIVVLIVTFAPRFSDNWPSTARASGTEIPKSITSVKQPTLPPPGTSQTHAIIDVAAANLRAAPAVTAQVITRLRRGDAVTSGERHGDWVHVLVNSGAGKPAHDGWIYSTSLKATDAH